MTDKKLIQECINQWGIDIQKVIAIEECGELIQAITKDLRGFSNKKCLYNIAEEIADLKICLDFLDVVYTKINPNFNNLINDYKEYKLHRLKSRLKEEKEE